MVFLSFDLMITLCEQIHDLSDPPIILAISIQYHLPSNDSDANLTTFDPTLINTQRMRGRLHILPSSLPTSVTTRSLIPLSLLSYPFLSPSSRAESSSPLNLIYLTTSLPSCNQTKMQSTSQM